MKLGIISIAASVAKESNGVLENYYMEDGLNKYADMELDELIAIKGLFSELEKGEVSARKNGWISIDEAEKRLGL